ncbi:hypothetical protein FRC00_002663 [Tulasnella sp. 408]|nr:hypothetical protein FRC00_002663 [Tulasnella sp. 408]
MRLTLSSLFVLAAAAVATADNVSVNPPLDSLKPHPITPSVDSVKPIVGRMTNAKRLAMNLPPLKPKAIRRGMRSAKLYSTYQLDMIINTSTGTRAASAPRSNTSMLPPVPHTCNLLVKNSDGSTRGYVSRVWRLYGEYGIQTNQADSLEVTFYASPDDPSPVELDLSANNGPSPAYPFVGANSDNLGPGSSNHLYITSNTQTAAGSTPQSGDNNSFSASTGVPKNAESAIWKYNPTTQDISVQWINNDGSTPANFILYYSVDRMSKSLSAAWRYSSSLEI